MFARRKHRPEEDEPLVPHGLVWQATDEPEKTAEEPVDKWASASLGRMGVISPPIPWPSPKSASVIRREPASTLEFSKAEEELEQKRAERKLQTNAESDPNPSVVPTAQPEPQLLVAIPHLAMLDRSAPPTAQAVIPQSPTAVPHHQLEIIEFGAEDAAGNQSKRHEALARMLAAIRPEAEAICREMGKAVRTAHADAGARWKSIHFQERVRRITPLTQKCALGVAAASRVARTRVQAWLAKNAAPGARVKAAIGTFSLGTIKTSMAHCAERVRNQRVRVRVVNSPWMRSMIQRGKLAWVVRRQSMRRDPRLWTSMAMAGFSALLTLAVISGVSRYAPRADASRKGSSTATQSANPSAVIAPNVKRSKPAAGVSRSHHVQISHAKPSSTQNKPGTVAHRVRRANEEADYVAPDTYHYYGSRNGSR